VLNFLDPYPLIKGKTAFGVELIFNTKDSYTLIAVELTNNKEAVVVSRRFLSITLEELAKENTKQLPVYLVAGGKGIIHKKVKTDDYSKDQDLLNQVLPNASIKDFYLQKSIISNTSCWVSVIRKDVLDTLLVKLDKLKIFAVQISLGPFAIENTIQLVDKPILLTTTHELLIEENNILQMNNLGSVSNGETYNIEGEMVSSHEIIAFGAALNHFAPTNKLTPINCNAVDTFKTEHLNKNKLLIVGFGMLAFFFIVVLLNLWISSNYESSRNALQYQVNSKKKVVEELALLDEELKIKEQFIQGSGVARASKISFYVDQVALSIPKSIQLNQLFINPLKKRINKAEDINFTYNVIKITGTVSKSIELNNWVKELKKYEWINEIIIISFIQENSKTAGEFEIEIKIID